MADTFREAAFGQIVRYVTRNKLFKYPEEDPNFQLPWEAESMEPAEPEPEPEPEPKPKPEPESEPKEKDIESSSSSSSSSDSDHLTGNAEIEKASSRTPISPVKSTKSRFSRQNTDLEKTISSPKSLTRRETMRTIGGYSIISRATTREQTSQYTRERFEVEQEEAVDRQETTVIQPQKTTDGIILVDWYTTDDPANPQNWSPMKKFGAALNIFFYTFVVYCASAIYTSSEPGVMERFGVGQSKASLGLSMFVLGYGTGPLVFSPLSEVPVMGRNIPYILSFGLFVILSLPTALVDNYAGLLVLRFLTGFMGSPCLATGGATMGDIYSFMKLPYGLAFWTAAAFCAPALGPLLSGFSVVALNWRWSLWEVLMMSGPVFLVMFFTFPETSAANILLRRAKRLRKLTGNDKLRSQSEIDQGNKTLNTVVVEALWRPLQITFQDPSVLFVNVYTAFLYGIYYSFFEAFPLVYLNMYGFNLGEMGIVFTCIIVGCILGVLTYCSYVYFYLEPDIIKNGLRQQEHRLIPGLIFIWLLPIGLFIFGWTSRPDIHWFPSIVGITLFAYGAFVL